MGLRGYDTTSITRTPQEDLLRNTFLIVEAPTVWVYVRLRMKRP